MTEQMYQKDKLQIILLLVYKGSWLKNYREKNKAVFQHLGEGKTSLCNTCLKLVSAPLLMRKVATSGFLTWMARCRRLQPCMLVVLISAPASSRCLATVI